MDIVWSPWRYRYVSQASPSDPCLFCLLKEPGRDQENYVIFRGSANFVVLNRYPYTTGHLMIAPYEHQATLEEAGEATLTEMIRLARAAERHLRRLYRPKGFNLGFNVGECAGAGVAGHLHMHVVPRWPADSNFMTTIGETRVLPEPLEVTWERVARAFRESP